MSRAGMTGWLGVILSFLVLASGAPSPAGAKAEKQVFHAGYGFEPGESNRYKMEFNQETEVGSYSFITLVDMEITEKCIEVVGDTLFRMEITMDKIEASMRRNDKLLDSEIGDDITGQTFTFEITPRGETRNLKAKGYIENEKKVVELLDSILQKSFPELPDSEVAVGAKWRIEGSRSGAGESEMETEYEAEYIAEEEKKVKGRKCRKIKSKSDVYMHGKMSGEEGDMILDGTGNEEVEMYFDVEGGKVMKLKSKMELDLTGIDASRSSAAAREAQEMSIVYTLKMEIK